MNWHIENGHRETQCGVGPGGGSAGTSTSWMEELGANVVFSPSPGITRHGCLDGLKIHCTNHYAITRLCSRQPSNGQSSSQHFGYPPLKSYPSFDSLFSRPQWPWNFCPPPFLWRPQRLILSLLYETEISRLISTLCRRLPSSVNSEDNYLRRITFSQSVNK